MRIQKAVLSFLVIFGLPFFSIAQVSHGGTPLGLQKQFQSAAKSQKLDAYGIGSVDAVALIKEDRLKGLNRVAKGVDVSINLDNRGTWTTLDNGDKVWRIKIESDNALGMSVLFRKFRIPHGGKLFAYTPDGTQIKGSYTHLNNKPSEKFMIGIIKGGDMILEYYEPAAVSGLGYFEIYKAFKVYDGAVFQSDLPSTNKKLAAKDFGDSAECHINANCTEAQDWSTYKRGIARITMIFDDAMGFCTGTLMNNVAEDETPYILTAFHCSRAAEGPIYDHWQFDFNYIGTDCTNPDTEPVAQSIQGASFRAGHEPSDFVLLELNEDIPTNFDVLYHGWDRSAAAPDTAIMMHHPQGDIMKYAFAANDIAVWNNAINWSSGVTTPPMHHFRTFLKEGAFETGSSGSSFINSNGHVVGQLHGGTAMCSGSITYIGRLFRSWSNSAVNNSLQPFLDPQNSGVMTLDAKETSTVEGVMIAGKVVSVKGVPMEGVEIQLAGSQTASTTTDVDGNYSFLDLPTDGDYIITPIKNSPHFDGISTADMVALQRDILGINEFDSPDKFIAADANNNQKISTGDMLAIQRLILGIYTDFPDNTSWRFYTSDFPAGLSEPNPFTAVSTTGSMDSATISMPAGSIMDLDFVGVKVGDPSQSVNPNK